MIVEKNAAMMISAPAEQSAESGTRREMLTDISLPMLLAVLLLPAVTFALAYSPIVNHLTRSLNSPYSKADVAKRFNAALVDGLVVVSLCLFYWTTNSSVALSGVGSDPDGGPDNRIVAGHEV